MADNVTLNAMSGGDVAAADDIGGVKYQRVKIGHGADGSYSDASTATPLPVAIPGTPNVFVSNTPGVTVTGTAAVAVASGTSIGSLKATVATAGVRVQLGTHAGIIGATVKARATNAGLIYVGGSTVSATSGFELAPGESVSLDVNNTNAIYIDAATGGDGVSYVWVNA